LHTPSVYSARVNSDFRHNFRMMFSSK